MIANLKESSPDLISDSKAIYKHQLNRFRDVLYDDERIEFEQRIEALANVEATSQSLVRVYLVTELDMFLLAMHNTESAVLDNMMRELKLAEPKHPQHIKPNYISTLFVFQGSKMTFHCDVSVKNAIELPIAFYKENLLNKGAFRDAWYGKPRRAVRRKSNQNH